MSHTIIATDKAREITVKQTVSCACIALWQEDQLIIVDRLHAKALIDAIKFELGLTDV